jgi:hypothetical protein
MIFEHVITEDSLTVIGQSVTVNANANHAVNVWMWIAIAEIGVILYLLFKNQLLAKNIISHNFKQDFLNQEVDFNNIINSSFNSSALYDMMKVKCHPDKFADDNEKYILAEEIFQEITKNKMNYKKLLILKDIAKKKLNINF